MKEIDKMARDYEINCPDLCEEHSGQCLAEAFKAGFQKAREMALECVLDGENIPNEYYTQDIERNIKALGESEVKD